MNEVWQRLYSTEGDNILDILNRGYRLRGNWHHIKHGSIKNNQYYKERQEEYLKLKNKLFDFLEKHLQENKINKLCKSFEDVDSVLKPPAPIKNLYSTIPRKINSATSEAVYLQKCLVEDMYIYYQKPNYSLVATIVDVLLNQDSVTNTDNVQHNTKDVANAFSGRTFQV